MERPTKKVLRVIARLNVGGPALHCVLLSKKLSEEGFETVLVTGQTDVGEANYEELFQVKPEGYRLIHLKKLQRMPSFAGDIRTLIEMIQIIRREKPDVVHTHTAKAGMIGRVAAIVTGVPVIVHTFHGHVLSGYFSPFFSKAVCWLERLLALKTTAIVTLSPKLKEELSKRFRVAPPDRFRTIPLGRDLEPFFHNLNLQGKLRSEIPNLGEKTFLFGIVGRLVPIKNHQLLLEACAKLPKPLDWALAIIGEGTLEKELKALCKELGIADKVHFLGWRNDLDYLYAGLDAMVLSSINEGTPLSIIESFASGCPVISTRVGGVSDLFTPTGIACEELEFQEEGILVPSQNSLALSKALRRFADDEGLRIRSGKAARVTAKKYTAEALSSRIAGLYRELLGAPA